MEAQQFEYNLKLEEDMQLQSMSPIQQKIRDALDAFNKNLGDNDFTPVGCLDRKQEYKVRHGNGLIQWPAHWVHRPQDGDVPSVPSLSVTQRFVDSIRDAGIECSRLTSGQMIDTTIYVPLGTTAKCEYTLNIVEESHTMAHYSCFLECRLLEFVMTFPDNSQCKLIIRMEEERIPDNFELVIHLFGKRWDKDVWDERLRDIVLFAQTALSAQDEPYAQFFVESRRSSAHSFVEITIHSRCAQWGLRLRQKNLRR
jgi:hypothetical protein